MPTRQTYLSATLDGASLSGIKSASSTYSWKQNNGIPMATISLRTDPDPGSPAFNKVLRITMGAGTNNILSFDGLVRRTPSALWPPSFDLWAQGILVRALEFQNRAQSVVAPVGGLLLFDLLGTPTGTDADIVAAALDLADVPYSSIGGTGVTWGSRSPSTNFLWRSGSGTNPLIPLKGAGSSALGFMQDWDKVSAVYSSPTAPAGFYRTYQTINGVRRALIGGRPRNTVDVTFTEGIDIEQRAQADKAFPVANGVFCSGYDPGLGIGPVRNQEFDALTSGNTGDFLGQSENDYQPAARSVVQDFGSPFIEWGTEAEGGIGMNCERVANAMLVDLNRITVTAHLRTPRDDLVMPGMTILVQGPGGLPGRLGIGQNLWVDTVTRGVAEDGEFYQDIDATGGGLADSWTPAPPV